MNISEAVTIMKRERKLTHPYFSPHEWVTINKEGLYEMEDGATIDGRIFWNDRSGKGWAKDWEVFHEQKKEQSSKHTEGEYVIGMTSIEETCISIKDGKGICSFPKNWGYSEETIEANAAHIVKCVNSFPALVEALRTAIKAMEDMVNDFPFYNDDLAEIKLSLKNAVQ